MGLLRNHGFSDTPTYRSWAMMKTRCNNPNIDHHKYYEGITYDPRWEKFLNFLEDMGEKPLGTTLDRVNSDKNYTKENCRWATIQQQNCNRRSWISKYKGVRKRPSGNFQVQIKINRKLIYIGCFKSERIAAIAYNEAAKKYHGEFACLNKIEEL